MTVPVFSDVRTCAGAGYHQAKECGGRVKEAAARLGARKRWKHRQRQRLGIKASERTAAGA